MNNSPLTIAQIIGALKRHKFKAFFSWLLVMVFCLAAYVVWPRMYGSEGRLYVQIGRNNTSVSPTSGSASISIQDTRETEIRSVVEIIKSRAVIDAVVNDIGAAEILKGGWSEWIPNLSMPKLLSNNNSVDGLSPEEYDELKQKEIAAQYLEKAMNVNSEKKTSVISVFVKARSAKLAQRIAESVFEHTRAVHLKVHASARSAIFFDDQFEQQQKVLVKSVEALAEFKNKNEVLSIGSARSTLQGIIASLENDELNTRINLDEQTEKLGELNQVMSGVDATMVVEKKGVERTGHDNSLTELFKLKAEKERLLATYSEDHPLVVPIIRQVRELQESLDSMKDDRTELATVSNPVYEDMQVDLLRTQAAKAASEARLKSVQSRKSLALARLKELNVAEVEADKLQRDIEIARQYLGIYTQKRGESKAMSLLDELNVSDVVSAQDPTLNFKPVSPKGKLMLPLGFIGGLFAALATALFFERNHLSSTLNEGEVEQILDLPVLVTLPRVYSSRNMVN